MTDQINPPQQISLEHIAEITQLAANVAKFGMLIQQMFNELKKAQDHIAQLESEINKSKS